VKTTRKPTARRSTAKPARRAAKPAARAKSIGKRTSVAKRAAGKHPPAAKRPAVKRAAPRKVSARPASSRSSSRGRARTAASSAGRWLRFVEKHGVVLASAHGPVPCVADAVAGQPIVGSWWAHPKGKAIFAALSEIDDSDDVRCFKLVDGKVTFVHRRVWPALARLASEGAFDPARVASIQQEHMPTGEHRNLVTPFPDWVPDDVARTAQELTVEAARAQLGAWLGPG
jgi:hypothetical protein